MSLEFLNINLEKYIDASTLHNKNITNLLQLAVQLCPIKLALLQQNNISQYNQTFTNLFTTAQDHRSELLWENQQLQFPNSSVKIINNYTVLLNTLITTPSFVRTQHIHVLLEAVANNIVLLTQSILNTSDNNSVKLEYADIHMLKDIMYYQLLISDNMPNIISKEDINNFRYTDEFVQGIDIKQYLINKSLNSLSKYKTVYIDHILQRILNNILYNSQEIDALTESQAISTKSNFLTTLCKKLFKIKK